MSNSTVDAIHSWDNSVNDAPNHIATTTNTVVNDGNNDDIPGGGGGGSSEAVSDGGDDNNLTCGVNGGDGGGSSAAVAKGISSILSSVIRDFDSRAVSATQSQDKLLSALDRLTLELDQLLEDAPLPFIMQHAAKLSNVKRRVSSLNTVLRSIQRRIDNVDRMISVSVPNDKSNVGGLK